MQFYEDPYRCYAIKLKFDDLTKLKFDDLLSNKPWVAVTFLWPRGVPNSKSVNQAGNEATTWWVSWLSCWNLNDLTWSWWDLVKTFPRFLVTFLLNTLPTSYFLCFACHDTPLHERTQPPHIYTTRLLACLSAWLPAPTVLLTTIVIIILNVIIRTVKWYIFVQLVIITIC